MAVIQGSSPRSSECRTSRAAHVSQRLAVHNLLFNGLAFDRGTYSATLLRPSNGRTSSLRDIDEKPDCDAGAEAKGKEEGEAFPVVACAVDDRLDDVRANHGGGAVRETEETEELFARISGGRYKSSDSKRTMLSYPGGVSSAIIV